MFFIQIKLRSTETEEVPAEEEKQEEVEVGADYENEVPKNGSPTLLPVVAMALVGLAQFL